MCTIITIDREFYNQNKEDFIRRTRVDSVLNPDGFALTMIGKTDEDVVTVETMSYNYVMRLIEKSDRWTRIFLHSRLATTATKNIFTCHNFLSNGNGEGRDSDEHWIVQHNGYYRGTDGTPSIRTKHYYNSHTKPYLVDSSKIANLVGKVGVDEAQETILKNEYYTNVFLINPANGEYRVVRCVKNTLYTDGQGNYSTKICGSISQPVAHNTSYKHQNPMEVTKKSSFFGEDYWREYYGVKSNKKTEVSPQRRSTSYSYMDIDEEENELYEQWMDRVYSEPEEEFTDYLEEEEEGEFLEPDITSQQRWQEYNMKQEEADICDIIDEEIEEFGDLALANQDDEFRFFIACQRLGFINTTKVPNNIYSNLTSAQKGWLAEIRKAT